VSITDVSVKNPVFAWMIMFGVMLFGLVALSRIGVSQYPDVDYPNISVSIPWTGASPPEVERSIVEPVEQAISQVEGVKSIASQARAGSARITATFDMSRDVDLALQDVQAKVASSQRQLPQDISPISVSKSNPDDQPILQLAVTGAFSKQMLADVAQYQVQERLQTVEGVGSITLSGVQQRNIRIWLDSSKMLEKGVAAEEVISAIKTEHVEVPGGAMDTGGRTLDIRMLGEALDIDEFRRIVVRKTKPPTLDPKTGLQIPGSAPVRLEEVASVEDGFEDVSSISRLDGVPIQTLAILKQRGTNAVAVAQSIRSRVDEINKSLPEGMKVEVLFDSTIFISESVHELELELALAVGLTAFVCWLFLGSLSSTMNVVLAIPMSLLGTVAAVYFCGFTLNTFTLLGLSLAVGLVVDDAVMVMENIYRHAEMGKDKVKASLDGTKEITFAALAATLAVIAIFMPVVFMNGVIGKFFFQFGVTLSVAVMISYFEAITLAPARCSQMLNTSREGRSIVGRTVDAAFERLEGFYARNLARALRHPGKVLFVALCVLASCGTLVTKVKTEFIPSQDQSRLNVRITTEAGTTPQAALPLLAKAEAKISQHPEIDRMLVTLTGSSGQISLTLLPPEQRKQSAQQLMMVLRKELQGIPGVRGSVQDPSQQGFGAQGGSPIDFTVRGSDWDALVKASSMFLTELEKAGFGTDLTTDYTVGGSELQIIPDRRRATDLGVSIASLGTTVSTLVGGNTVGKFSTKDGRRIDVRVRLLAFQRTRPEDLGLIRIRGANNGNLVPLSMVVNQQEQPVLNTINRLDRERSVEIKGNVGPGHSQQEAMNKVYELAKSLPIGIRVQASGQASQLEETTGGLAFAMSIGILVAYMVLASQFNSFLHPVTVLTILPLAVCGAIIGLLVSGKTLNLFSMIGLLLLMGIVKKNSILLVEYAEHVRHEEHCDAATAAGKAGPLRLRPILMTTVATMMSAVPPILGLGPGTETRSPMAAAVLGGLIVSTLLSLVVVPAFYVVSDRIKAKVFKPKPAAGTPEPHPH
jgi:hydrophobe/amphiphile efflux-1 (HAE1) family protein